MDRLATSSPHLVSEVKRLKSDPTFYGKFLERSHLCVEKLIHAFKTNHIKGVQQMIRLNREIIQSMDKEATIDIETNTFKDIVLYSLKSMAATKTSGVVVEIVVLQLLKTISINKLYTKNGSKMM